MGREVRTERLPRPIKSTSNESRFGVVVRKEILPLELLEPPVLNSRAKQFLRNKTIATNNSLESMAGLTIPVASTEVSHNSFLVLTPESFGRTSAAAYGLIEFANMYGGVIIRKGDWLSGKKAFKPERVLNDPEGLFGAKDSATEADVSNDLIAAGFRSSLSLGHIPLKAEKTQYWLIGRWHGNLDMCSAIQNSFNIVEGNGDVPVLDFRVGGVSQRIRGLTDGIYTGPHCKGSLALASRLIEKEFDQFSDNYRDYLNHPDCFRDYRDVLRKISHRNYITEQELYYFIDIYMAIGRKNAKALEIFIRMRCESGKGIPDDISTILTYGRDIDYAGFTYDYELFNNSSYDDPDPNITKHVDSYLKAWWRIMRDWHHKLTTPSFLSPTLNILDFDLWFSRKWNPDTYTKGLS